MGIDSGSSNDLAGWLDWREVKDAAVAIGVRERQLEDWRAWGLVPRPTRDGYLNGKPRWRYPPQTIGQLNAAARWRARSKNSAAIRVALWAEGFPFEFQDTQAAIVEVLTGWETIILHELARHAPASAEPNQLLNDPQALNEAVAAWANELARLRSRLPLPRRVDTSLAERRRAMTYWLALLLGLDANPEDAVLLERVFGISRGRSGTANGLLTWEPAETFPARGRRVTPQALRTSIEGADAITFQLVAAALGVGFTLIPLVLPIAISTMSTLRPFIDDATQLIESVPPEAITLIAAFMITNVERSREANDDLRAHHLASLQPDQVLADIGDDLPAEALQVIENRLKQRSSN